MGRRHEPQFFACDGSLRARLYLKYHLAWRDRLRARYSAMLEFGGSAAETAGSSAAEEVSAVTLTSGSRRSGSPRPPVRPAAACMQALALRRAAGRRRKADLVMMFRPRAAARQLQIRPMARRTSRPPPSRGELTRGSAAVARFLDEGSGFWL